MPGIGLQGAWGAAGAQDALQQLLAQRMLERQYADKLRQQEIENQQADTASGQRSRALDIQEQAANLREVPKPVTLGPGQSLVDPSSGRIVSQIPALPDHPISLAPGGSLVDPSSGRILTQITAKPEKERTIGVETVDEAGNPVTRYLSEGAAMGKAFPKPPSTASGGPAGLQRARAQSAIDMLQRLQAVHARLQTSEGPGQIAKGISAATGGRINLNNAATEYQKLRRATAVAMAVAIQGSRPSDADAEAMASLLPDFITPSSVADNLFDGAKKQLAGTMEAMSGRPSPLSPKGPLSLGGKTSPNAADLIKKYSSQ